MSEDFDFSDVTAEPAESNVMPRTSGTRRQTRRSPGSKRQGDLKTALTTQTFQAGAMIGLGLPVTGYYICQESDAFCEAVVKLAGKRPEWIEALEQIANIAPGVTIGRTVLGVGCAIGVDRWHKTEGESGISPDKRAALFLGVAKAYQEVYGESDGNAEGAGFADPPSAFVPIS